MKTFSELLRKLGTGTNVSNTSYETAWIARLRDVEPEISNRALDWICEHQLADGSWGAEFPMYYHDRVICTLSAMIALTYKGRRHQDKVQIQKGLDALSEITEGATRGLQADPHGATVGFEMIVPTLVAEAEELGIIKQQKERILGRLAQTREIKMKKLAGVQISRTVSIAHSSEMTGRDKIDLIDIENLQENNGSVANSPSATAHFALYVKPGDQNAMNYLSSISDPRNGGAPSFAPFDILERNWVLWNLLLTDEKDDPEIMELCKPHVEYLERNWKNDQGLGFSVECSLTDGDDTSVGQKVLAAFGRVPDVKALHSYEGEDWFRCYDHESNPSIDVNLHFLDAFKQIGYDARHPSVVKIINFLRASQNSSGYWSDKWHVSPYYTTAHAIMACLKYDDAMCEKSIDWILNAQKSDGSWGIYKSSTAEETAYCIQALDAWNKSGRKILKGKMLLARNWLIKHAEEPHQPLWIDKSLYCPEVVVQSAILSALSLARDY